MSRNQFRAHTSQGFRDGAIRERSATERQKEKQFHATRHSKESSTYEPNVPSLGRGIANVEARRYRANSVMELSPHELKEAFQAQDRSGQGYLDEQGMQNCLLSVGVRMSRARLRDFMSHIAGVRMQGIVNRPPSSRPTISIMEFMNNRASFMTLDVPASKGHATLYTTTSTNVMAGIPPRKVLRAQSNSSDLTTDVHSIPADN